MRGDLGIARAVRAATDRDSTGPAWWHFLPSSQAELWRDKLADYCRESVAMDAAAIRFANWRAARSARQLRRAA